MSKIGEGVHDIYKERASKGGDVLWHCTIKGQNELSPGIPLHMSLKVWDDRKDMDMDEIKRKVEVFDIKNPIPEKLTFKTTIFTSQRDGNKYYMLTIAGVDPSYEEFYNSMKHCGTVYQKFMPHVTIDKGLYDKINEEGLKPEEVSFTNLSVEFGAGNTVHVFSKTEVKKSEELFLVRETIGLNFDLQKHQKAVKLSDDDLVRYLQDNPGLKEEVMKKHEKRLESHFGNNKELIDLAWKNGLKAAYDALSRK